LGAGASHFAGYPLGTGLWDFILKNTSADVSARTQDVSDFIDCVAQAVFPKDFDRPDLELLFTRLDLANLGAEPALQFGRVDEITDGTLGKRWQSVRPKLIGMITNAFQYYQYKLQDRLRDKSDFAGVVLERWASILQEGDIIVTFNWDVLHEAALWDCDKWHYADGYGFMSDDTLLGYHSSVKVFKLHGSVNWAQSDRQDSRPAMENRATFFRSAGDDPRVFPKRPGAGWNEGRELIIPTYLKDVSSNRFFVGLWNQALDAISTAERITVIGFQLHPADALARQLLALALTRNASRYPIQIVLPATGADHWDAFCYSIGRPRERIRMKFEDWVLNGGGSSRL
jgi:hypothetical protein